MLTPVFLFFLLNVRYTWHRILFFLLNVRYMWHRIHQVKGPSLRNSRSGIPDPEFRSKLILPWNDLIPMCVPPESGNSAANPEFRKMRTGINWNTGRNAQPSPQWQPLPRTSTSFFFVHDLPYSSWLFFRHCYLRHHCVTPPSAALNFSG